MYDTLIIGAGCSGLAAGIRLAHYGQKVAILERHYTIGGLNSFYRLHGRDFDVGLHAVTNFALRGTRKGPLATIMRRLQLDWDDFDLAPQAGSAVAFPGRRMRFTNDPLILEAEVAREFPDQIDNYRRLVAALPHYDDVSQELYAPSARETVARYITDPLLAEMLFCPLMWYGNGREHDMDWGQFAIMFRSCFLEGFGRPFDGVRQIFKVLVKKYRTVGGELKLRAGVARIKTDQGRAVGVVLDNGEELECKQILSSAGWYETLRMCPELPVAAAREPGRLSFVETLSVIDTQPKAVGCNDTVLFYNDSNTFHWQRPEEMCDVRTGVICSPNNYDYQDELGSPLELKEGLMRVTALANFDRWTGLSEDEYRAQKQHWFAQVTESAVRFTGDYRPRTVATDMFTPRTIERFTWHTNGCVYGAPMKQLDGQTPIENLYVCGTDQGYVGIVGSMVGGITQATKLLR